MVTKTEERMRGMYDKSATVTYHEHPYSLGSEELQQCRLDRHNFVLSIFLFGKQSTTDSESEIEGRKAPYHSHTWFISVFADI